MKPFPILGLAFEGFAWALAALVPALIALYFLKLRRERVLISSTFLWKRAVEDMRVNAPFQKLRRSLLLLLQLLALIALILAASKPIITGAGAGGRAIIVLVDHSASMNVREDDGTRLEAARREARTVVDGLVGGDRMAVIAFASRSTVLQPLTDDRVALRKAIDEVPATSLPTDLIGALRTAGALAESIPGAELVLIGDGAYTGLSSPPSEVERLPVKFVAVGKGEDNLGITEMDLRRGFGTRGGLEVFALVSNPTGKDRRTALGVYRDDRLIAATELEVPAGKSRSHSFNALRFLGEEGGGAVTLRLEISEGGILADDDRAWIRAAPPGRLDVLVVGESNGFLDKVLAVQPLVDARRFSLEEFEDLSRTGRLAGDAAKVLIFDRRAPPGLPDRPALYIGCAPDLPELAPPPGGGEAAKEAPGLRAVKGPVIVDWDRSHPVNRFLAFADLAIAEATVLGGGKGYRSLIESSEGSIAGTVSIPSEGRLPAIALVIGFDVFGKSNWPWLHSFPIFFGNALAWLGEAAGSEAQPRSRTGEVLSFYPGDRKLVDPMFRDPASKEHPASPSRTGELTFAGTDLAGIYELRSEGKTVETYAVSLIDAAETSIAPRKEIRLGGQVVRSEAEAIETKDLWKWFVLAALLVALVEWWIYWKRVV
jgi:hypothetical protein